MPITIADIAREAGVSRATVSGVLNNNPNVSAKTNERVSEIIRKYKFTPNAVARALALQYTGLIGLIVKDISNPLYSKISLGVEEICEKEGYNVIIGNTHTSSKREVEHVELLKQRRVDGLIVFPLQKNVDISHLQDLEQSNLPFVLLADVPGIEADLVRCDDEAGAFEAVQHLIRGGRKKLFYISGPAEFIASDRRLNGFRRAHQENGLEFHESQVVRSGWRLADGYATGVELAKRPKELPDGLFCYNDPVATGLIRGLSEHGISVPRDIGAVGFDDDVVSAYLNPGLSTVAQPALEIGRAAATRLLSRIRSNSENWQPEKQYLKTNLVIRESCGCSIST
jgi:DNA-binding LacI/PurR family transcriptional regulator